MRAIITALLAWLALIGQCAAQMQDADTPFSRRTNIVPWIGALQSPGLLVGAPSATFSASGTGIGANAPAAFGGNLEDLQVGGVSKYSVSAAGALTLGTPLAVSNGGTGLTSGTSGGVPYFSSTSAISSSALLTQFGVMYGGGAGVAPAATAAGTNGQLLLGQTSAAPSWASCGGDCSSISAAGSFTMGKLNGVTYGSSPSTNTVPVVTSSNTITYEAVPNAALANSTFAVTNGYGGSVTSCGSTVLGSTCTLGATTDTLRFAGHGLGMAAPATGINIGNAIVTVSSNGQMALGASSTAGAQLQGKGSTSDFTLENSGGSTVCSVATGGTTINCATLTLTNPLAIAQGGTGSTSQQNALNAIAPSPTRAGDLIYYNGSNWVDFAGNNSGTNCLEENSSGVPSWASCGGGSSTITANSTATSGFSAGQIIYSDGSLVQATTKNVTNGSMGYTLAQSVTLAVSNMGM